MDLPKVTGIETEYGIFIRGASKSNPFYASQLLLQHCDEAGEMFWERGNRVKSQPVVPTIAAAQATSLDSLMLPNGARFYIDHAHPEYSTAETIAPRDVVAADKAGEIIVERCRQRANASGVLPAGQDIAVYKNNSDQKGNSYGCHENYMLAARTYEALVDRKGHLALRVLVPFLVTRSILCGAGKVGSENGTAAASFQLTQRADFFETLFGLQTTHHRPLVNTRDESHADRSNFGRLHVIVGDANMAEYSTYLKVGTTQLVLMMIESERISLNLTLKDPVAAVKTVSRDLPFREQLPLARGSTASAVEIQYQYLQQAKQYLSDGGGTEAMREVVRVWEDTLDRLERDWHRLSGRLDWAIKRNLLERYLQSQDCDWHTVNQWQLLIAKTLFLNRQAVGENPADLRVALPSFAQLDCYLREEGLDWSDYWRQREIYFTLRRLNLEYHDIRRDLEGKNFGLFYRLQQSGAVERLLTEAEIERLVNAPPPDTRAYLRGYCIAHYANCIQRVDWGEIKFYNPKEKKSYSLKLPHLTDGTQAQVGDILETLPDQPTLLQFLEKANDIMSG